MNEFLTAVEWTVWGTAIALALFWLYIALDQGRDHK